MPNSSAFPTNESTYGSVMEEGAALLKPSASSTDRPTAKNNLLEVEPDVTARLLNGPGSNGFQSFQNGSGSKDVTSSKLHERNMKRKGAIGLVIAVIAAVAVMVFRRSSAVEPAPVAPLVNGALSILDPVEGVGLATFVREGAVPPPGLKARGGKSFPTNAWYSNLLLLDGEPDLSHRVYSMPYIVDAAGPIPGLRVQPNHVTANTRVIEVSTIPQHGLTLGAIADSSQAATSSLAKTYTVVITAPLGVTLKWDAFPMASSIVKGMPYATMVYDSIHSTDEDGKVLLPTVASEIALAWHPVVDETTEVTCAVDSNAAVPFQVDREIKMFFRASDFTWLLFVSEPVMMQCVQDDTGGVNFQVIDWAVDSTVDRELVVRVALDESCTSGSNPTYCHTEMMHPTALMLGQGNYENILRAHAGLYPGPNSDVSYEINQDTKEATLLLHWDVRNMTTARSRPFHSNGTTPELIAYALPHHLDMYGASAPTAGEALYCTPSLTGLACLLEGPEWSLPEQIPEIGLRAPRPPAPWSIGSLAESIRGDINFTLPEFFQRGAGDTYFSGKMLAKLARILLIGEEVEEICQTYWISGVDERLSRSSRSAYDEACAGISLPDEFEFAKGVDSLKSSVEIWINGSAEVPLVYDSEWGGVASCGCLFDDGKCTNQYPDCPGFTDPGLNFGNAWYNDQHFHYGYHIYSAAVVAHFDPAWGREHFEQVLLLVRSIANPSEDDEYFPRWRHKDWYQGHSWASGIATAVLNGRNQESSSESIAAYEAVAVYGTVMAEAWKEEDAPEKIQASDRIRDAGQMMTATELRSTKRYWHVKRSGPNSKIYPTEYSEYVIGVMWQTMAQFQTWFGLQPYFAYGIQVIPMTPIAEARDSVEWSKEMYHSYAGGCDGFCKQGGWDVPVLAMLATVGHPQLAAQEASYLPLSVYEDAGGNGHSLTNTLWYFATRPTVDEPLVLDQSAYTYHHHGDNSTGPSFVLTDCYRPDVCNDYVLDTIAGLYSCRQRIQWLITAEGKTQEEACRQIASVENPDQCGSCDPSGGDDESAKHADEGPVCPSCTAEECASPLNRCPSYEKTFVCTEGPSKSGCSRTPWNLNIGQCSTCCELTACLHLDDVVGDISHGTEIVVKKSEVKDKHKPTEEEDTVSEGKDSPKKEEDTVSEGKDTPNKEEGTVSEGKDTPNKEEGTVSEGNETRPAEQESPPGMDNTVHSEDEEEEVQPLILVGDGNCPPCKHSICTSSINQCPKGGDAPYLCTKGANAGGCSGNPWEAGQCALCCKILPGCTE